MLKGTTYRGKAVIYACYDRRADSYSLIGTDDECLAELKAREFLSLPNRNNLEVRNGRYWRPGKTDKRRADRKSGITWGIDPAADDSYLSVFAPAIALTSTQPAANPSLSAAELIRMYDDLKKSMVSSIYFGSAPSPAHVLWQSVDFDENPRPPLKRESIVAGEIVGFRCWRVERGLLASVYQPDVWHPGKPLEGRELGDWDSRGIHAWKDAASKHYHEYIRNYLNSSKADSFWWPVDRSRQPAMVTGTVFLWGDVVEHERGFRAEFARVRSLDWLYPDETMMGSEPKWLEHFRSLYGV